MMKPESRIKRWVLPGAVAGLALACFAGSASAGYVDTVSSQSPEFYWRLNDTVKGTIAVEVDNSATADNSALVLETNDMILGDTSGASLTPAGGFAGMEVTNSWFTIPGTNSSDLISNLTNPKGVMSSTLGSVTNWIKTTTGPTPTYTYGTLLRVDQGGTGSLYTFIDNDGKFGVRITNGSGETTVLADVRTTNAYNDGQWHHVAATWDESAGQAIIYVDGGSLLGGETVIGTFTDGVDFVSSGRLQFGKGHSNSLRYVGSADELAIWTGALSSQQIAAQYQSAIPEPASAALIGLGALALCRRSVRD